MPGLYYCGNGVLSPSIGGGKMMDNPCDNCPKQQRCTTDKWCSRWKGWFREHWQEAQRLWQGILQDYPGEDIYKAVALVKAQRKKKPPLGQQRRQLPRGSKQI